MRLEWSYFASNGDCCQTAGVRGDGWLILGASERLEPRGGAEFADDGSYVALAGVDFGVHMAHFGGGDFSGEVRKREAERGEFCEGVAADYGDGVVRWEIVTVVGEADEMERVDKAIGGITSNDVDFLIDERAVDEAEVHDAGRFSEMQAVALGEAAVAVGAFEKFVADAGAPFWSERNEVGDGAQVKLLSVRAADDHSEGVFESERLGDYQIEALGVALFDALVDGGFVGVVAGDFVQDGGECGAGVFDVEI